MQSLMVMQIDAHAQSQAESASSTKVVKKKKRRRKKRVSRARLGQLSGMTDEDKSLWMMKHCKVSLSYHM